MHSSNRTYIALALFALALCAWIAAALFLGDLSSKISAHAEALSNSSVDSAKAQNNVELHAIISGTSQERSALDALVGTDVVGIANDIQNAGQAAGTKTTIGSASAISSANAQSGATELEFVVESTGSFSQVWRAAQLFGTLPLPSSAKEFDFQQIPNNSGGGSTWQLTARIDVLTSSPISS